jgi:CO dehydrogenase maturation factor
MKIAISGKGGVGKTTIMALLASKLSNNKEVLVIDADPSPHMAQTLGFKKIDGITPLAEMTKLLTDRSAKTEGSPFYNINPKIHDLPDRFMLSKDNIKLMILGAIQTGNKGCACPENTVLRRLLTKLLLESYQVILLDMEAGVEHLGRGTIAGIDHLLVVVNPSNSSIRTAKKIDKLADDVGIPKVSFVGNLIDDQDDNDFLIENLPSAPIASFPNSKEIRHTERAAQPIQEITNHFKIETELIIKHLGL